MGMLLRCPYPVVAVVHPDDALLDDDGLEYLTDASNVDLQEDSLTYTPDARGPALPRALGGWCWYNDPRAFYYNGYTYYGYTANTGDNMVHQYHHATGTNGAPFVLHTALGVDDHNAPGLLLRDSDKRLLAFYSVHGGPTIYQRTSTNAEDVSAWGAEASLAATLGGSDFSYPNPVQLTGEASDPIYLFWRTLVDANTQGWWFSKSTDDGGTWAARTQLYQATNRSGYVKMVANGTARIDFVVSDGHPMYDANVSVYHFYYQGGNYYKTDGTLIGNATALPLEPADLTKVYDGGTVTGWIWDIAIDGTGKPVIVYATFPATTNHRYNYARWTGAAWDAHEVAAAGGYLYLAESYYSGGIVLDPVNPAIVYYSKVVSGQWEVCKAVTADGGATWTETAITTTSAVKNIRPIGIRGHDASLTLLWLHGYYTTYTGYNLQVFGGAP